MNYNLKNVVLAALVVIVALSVGACSSSDDEIVVYSARREGFVRPVLESFEKETGIRVRLLTGGEALVNRIVSEGDDVKADVFLANDTGAMEFLRENELLAANDSARVASVDERYRAPDGSWVGISARTRVFMYNRDLISSDEMPTRIEDLADPRWANSFAVARGGNSSTVTHVAVLRSVWGDERTADWLSAINSNSGAVLDGHTAIRHAVGSGEFAFGLVNNYYYHLQSREPANNNVGVIYPDGQPGEMGAFVNAAGAALLRDAPNHDAAVGLIDYLLAPEQVQAFTELSRETPLDPSIPVVPEADPIDSYATMEIPLTGVGEAWRDARDLISESGLDLGLDN